MKYPNRRLSKVIRMILAGMLITGLVLAQTACGNTGRKKLTERQIAEKSELAVNLLKEKYSDDFEIARTFSDAGYNAVCRASAHPEVIFTLYMPDTTIASENYVSQVISRKIRTSCAELLSSAGLESCCVPLPNRVFLSPDADYSKGYDTIGVFDDFKELDYMILVYVPVAQEYDPHKMYELLRRFRDTANYSEVSMAFAFLDDIEMQKVQNYYDTAVLHEMLFVSTSDSASLYWNGTEFNYTEEEYTQKFQEAQTKALAFYQKLRAVQ